MLHRRHFLQLFCLGTLSGCVTPRRFWEKPFSGFDDDMEELEPTSIPEVTRRKPLILKKPPRVTMPDVHVRARSHWTKAPLLKWRLCKMGRVYRITVHHEGNPNANRAETWSEVVLNLRQIRRTHLRIMRAGDIGYHYIIDRRGRIWEGRPVAYQGAHAGGSANKGNIGVMLLGNFNIQHPTAQQKSVLEKFLRKLMATHRVHRNRIYTHKELKVTACPGKHLNAHVKRLRRRL